MPLPTPSFGVATKEPLPCFPVRQDNLGALAVTPKPAAGAPPCLSDGEGHDLHTIHDGSHSSPDGHRAAVANVSFHSLTDSAGRR